jgi:hypothetical protein
MPTFDDIHISPNLWPGQELPVQPGDFSQFVPMGMGLSAPLVMRPWDKLEDVAQRPGFYSFHPHSFHPIQGAPVTEPGGGTIYFDDGVTEADLAAVLRLMEVRDGIDDYAVFLSHSTDPVTDRYLTQLRFMSRGSLRSLFGVLTGDEFEKFPTQPLNLGQMCWAFIEHQRKRWGGGYSHALHGTLGGDGDWARESLCFGLMVENSYHGIYRLWSRAWLVTK